MKNIGIITKKGEPKAVELVGRLLPWFAERGYETCPDDDTARHLGVAGRPASELPDISDIIIVFGGDGTLLSAARLVGGRGIPILGVNLGGLGFMAEVPVDEVPEAIENALRGSCTIEERVMLQASVFRGGERIDHSSVLNDVVINKGALARIVSIDTAVDGRYLTTYHSDGLIVSTPTGSTAYSLSAGGPILYPTLKSLILTPICPHLLANRPIVLPDDFTISMTIASGEDVFLTMDGQVGFPLHPGDVVEVAKSPHVTRLLIPCERDYFQVLRSKLKWGER